MSAIQKLLDACNTTYESGNETKETADNWLVKVVAYAGTVRAARAELAALNAEIARLRDALLISGNLLADVKTYLQAEVVACGGVGLEYEIGLLDSIGAFQDLHGETVKELGEKYAALRGEA